MSAVIIEWQCRKSPFSLTGDRGFESISLQRRVCLSPEAACEGREPRLSARLCAAGVATGSTETRTVFRYRANGGSISAGLYSSTAVPLMWFARTPSGPMKSCLLRAYRVVDL